MLTTQGYAVCRRAGRVALSLAWILTAANAIAADDVPAMEQGIQIGDLAPVRRMVWSRTDRPARMMVEYAFNDQFNDACAIRGPYAFAETDFTAPAGMVGSIFPRAKMFS